MRYESRLAKRFTSRRVKIAGVSLVRHGVIHVDIVDAVGVNAFGDLRDVMGDLLGL